MSFARCQSPATNTASSERTIRIVPLPDEEAGAARASLLAAIPPRTGRTDARGRRTPAA